jgi:hypothetical protein
LTIGLSTGSFVVSDMVIHAHCRSIYFKVCFYRCGHGTGEVII